jgi:hypothetical protein
MVIAVITMRMVQYPLIEIVLMISVRNHLVPTTLMSARAADRSARGGILRVDVEHMLIIVPLV